MARAYFHFSFKSYKILVRGLSSICRCNGHSIASALERKIEVIEEGARCRLQPICLRSLLGSSLLIADQRVDDIDDHF